MPNPRMCVCVWVTKMVVCSHKIKFVHFAKFGFRFGNFKLGLWLSN